MKSTITEELKTAKTTLIIFTALSLSGCARNVDWVKARADAKWAELGYTVIGYEGYQWSPLAGGDVWYSLKRQDSPRVIYSGFLERWGDELMVYGPRAISGNEVGIHE